MGTKIIAKKYARALGGLIGNDLELGRKYLASMQGVLELFGIPKFGKILKSQAVPKTLKLTLLKYALEQEKAELVVVHFFETVVESGRIDMAPEIIASFEEFLEECGGATKALVSSAFEFEEAQLDALKKQLEQLFQKKIEFSKELDASLLGGFVVRIGNSLIDFSLKSKLELLTKPSTI